MSKEGVKIPVEINAHVFTLNGQTVMLSIARDITDRKRAEIVSEEGRGTRFTAELARAVR